MDGVRWIDWKDEVKKRLWSDDLVELELGGWVGALLVHHGLAEADQPRDMPVLTEEFADGGEAEATSMCRKHQSSI